MELRHIRYFQAIAETLSFTRAAERLHVTQPTLSHQIRQLESELNVTLFDRVGRRVRLTEEGELLRSHMEPALGQIDRGLQALRDGAYSVAKAIRVGTIPSFNLQVVPACVGRFVAAHPDYEVVIEELLLDGIVAGLSEGRLDLAVSYLPPNGDSLWFEPLYKEELRLVTGKDHPLGRRRFLRMTELHHVRMAMLPPNYATRKLLDEALSMAGAQPIVIVQSNTAPGVLEVVRHSDLVTVVAESAIRPHPELRVVPLQDPTPIRTPGLMWRKGAMRTKGIREFADLIRMTVREAKLKGKR